MPEGGYKSEQNQSFNTCYAELEVFLPKEIKKKKKKKDPKDCSTLFS